MDIEKVLAEVSPERLKLVAELHVRHFENLLQIGGRNVNVTECLYYKGLWTTAVQQLSAGVMWQDLPEYVRDEYLDAAYCGEYDKELGIDTSGI
jgi:hypothetical protein